MKTAKFITNDLDALDLYERGETHYGLDEQGWCFPIIKKILSEFKELTFSSYEVVNHHPFGVGYVTIEFLGEVGSFDNLQDLANKLFYEDENAQPDPVIRVFSGMTILFFNSQN